MRKRHEKPNPYQSLVRKIMNNPNLSYQIMIILLTVLTDNVPVDRGLQTVNSSIDKFRNIMDVLNHTMGALKVASDAPQKIRGIIK